MIGGITEPSRETLAELNRILGEGKYAISYARESAGLRTLVRTHDRPAREWSTVFAPGDSEPALAAVWQEFLSRIERSEGKRVSMEAGGAEESRGEVADDVPPGPPKPTPPVPDREPEPEPPPSDAPQPPESEEGGKKKRPWF